MEKLYGKESKKADIAAKTRELVEKLKKKWKIKKIIRGRDREIELGS